jgi:branched-chain amino acid transport system permease protein
MSTQAVEAPPSVRLISPRILVIVVLFVLIGAIGLAPWVSTSLSFWFYLLQWIVLASAINIMAGFTGYVPFGYVAFVGTGAYAGMICMTYFGWSFPLAIAASGLAGAGLALILTPTLRLAGVYFSLTSFSLAVVVQIIVSLLPSDIAGGSQGITLRDGPSALTVFYCMLALALGTVLIATLIATSRYGLMLKAIRDDSIGASASGINVPVMRLYAWLLSAGLGAMAGSIEAMYTSIIDTTTAFDMLISAKSLIYAALGGLGTVIGPVVGAVLISVLDQWIWQQTPTLGTFILGATLVVIIVYLPRGLLGTMLHRKPTLRKTLL